MKKRALLLVLPLFLTGCLFSLNQPLLGPDGTAALFLDEDGSYSPTLEEGMLHLLRGGEFIRIPAATISDIGEVLDWSPDGREILFVQHDIGEWLEPSSSVLYSVEAKRDGTPVALLESKMVIKDAAYSYDGRIAVLQFGEGFAGTLELLDCETGELQEFFDDVLAFRLGPTRTEMVALHLDDEGPAPIGRISRWRLEENDSETLAVFGLGEQMLETYYVLSDAALFDVDITGRWVAFSVFEQVMIDPLIEEETPTLYLVDTETESVQRLAKIGFLPSFSPDGRKLAYITSDDGDTGHAVLFDVETQQSTPVPASLGASTCFWLGNSLLGLTYEPEDDVFWLVTVDILTGESNVVVK